MKTLAALFLLPIYAVAAVSPADIERLATAARTLPPEFAADALIRLSAVDSLDRARRVEMLQDAFQKGGQAQQRYKVRSAMMGMPAAAALLGKVNQQELDGLELQARAVRALLALDAAGARKLFQSIRPVQPAAVPCDDFMVPDVDGFYQAMGDAVHSFDTSERQTSPAGRFLMPYTAVTSAVQVGPMATVIAESGVSDAEFTALVKAFGAAIGKIKGDDRSFSASYLAGSRMEALVAECTRRKVSPLPLLEAYRLYLVINLSGPRCGDDDRMQGGMVMASNAEAAANQPVDVVTFFNRKLRRDPLQPIQEGEATPSKLEGAVTGLRTCVDAECKAVTEQFRALLFDSRGVPIPPGDRDTRDWRTRLKELLEKVAAWQPGERTTPAEHFREEVLLYNDLVSVSPAGEARDAVLHSELQFLLKNRAEAASRIEWFLPVNVLLARTALDPLGFASAREELQKSEDPVLAVYAKLEAIVPRPPDRVMPLL